MEGRSCRRQTVTYARRPRRGRHSGRQLHIVPRAILRVYPTAMSYVGLGF